MSDLHQNGPELDLVGLPPSVRRYVYEGKDQFFRILQLERKRLLDSMRNSHNITDTHTESGNNRPEKIEITEYIIFSINPTTFHQDFLGPDPISLFSIRASFNPRTGLLIVKMITGMHTAFAFAIQDEIDNALGRMGLDEAIYLYHGVSFDINGQNKEADMAWGPRRLPHKTERNVHRDIDLWLDPHRGKANVAITIRINRQRPMISIDKWMWDSNNGTSRRSQHIEASEDKMGEVKVSGGPLIIPFRFFFLRDPDPRTRETDVIIDKECLQTVRSKRLAAKNRDPHHFVSSVTELEIGLFIEDRKACHPRIKRLSMPLAHFQKKKIKAMLDVRDFS
ncbi:uncharacterized protein PGRI_041590 [Penicillium griseofulvum]|uniref:Uncharacterized protein n=1 Tax=Penicillium patulum TaxID=5078 RepID=A0A135L8F5_PENPA|nr:uncharacterized protein PGRI_041590 [Penicillium griseofulvum]KXG45246.1 hypothetical protein PGRI_041590 [Penicillium griseofulvum]